MIRDDLADFAPTDLAECPEPACPTCGGGPWGCPDCGGAPGDDHLIPDCWGLPDVPPDAREWGPSAADLAWEGGYTAGREASEARVRELEYTVDRLETMLAEARAELLGRGR